jgi:murein DD-endopeptidase MepM/ murein hydrolase activator NlpD
MGQRDHDRSHVFYENHEKKKIRSVYAHLHELKVHSGEEVQRRQVIGSVGQDRTGYLRPTCTLN